MSTEQENSVAPAATPAPAVEEVNLVVPETAVEPQAAPSAGLEKDALATGTSLSRLFAELPSIVKEADYKEIWGIELADASHVPTVIVLQKFLRANSDDVNKAKVQLTEALNWRKRIQPLKLVAETEFDKSKFGDLGYVTTYKGRDGAKEIVTWNIYGAVKDIKETFGNVEEFIKWRCALMELSIKELNLTAATKKIPDNGPDPYRMIQVHDYLNVSFLRMDPTIRAASKETIQTFSMAYPELLKEKFFVNVPLIMGWVFTAMKLFLSPETIKKFHPLSYGSNLAGELPNIESQLPAVYGGKGKDIKEEGLTVKYASVEVVEAK